MFSAVNKNVRKAAAKRVASKKAIAKKRVAAKKAVKKGSLKKPRWYSKPRNKVENAKLQFVNWVKKHDPALYQIAEKRLARKAKMSGLAGVLDMFSSLVTTVSNVAPKIYEMSAQKKILDAQIKQAQQGQPPLNIQYVPAVPPGAVQTPVVQAKIEEAAKAPATPAAASMIVPGIVIGGLWLLSGRR